MSNQLERARSEAETLEYAITRYVDSWFDGLVKSLKQTPINRR